MKNICVFAGSSSGVKKSYKKIANDLGQIISKNNFKLFYGGGKTGLMGEVANSCLKNGGHVTGIIPKFLDQKEICHDGLSELIITKTMHERKQLMYQNASIFAVLPGGVGTIEELMEVLTWKQLDLLNQSVIVINVEGYWNPLIKLLKNIIKNKFMGPENILNINIIKNKQELTQFIEN